MSTNIHQKVTPPKTACTLVAGVKHYSQEIYFHIELLNGYKCCFITLFTFAASRLGRIYVSCSSSESQTVSDS